MTIVAMTGTRDGMTPNQKLVFRKQLVLLREILGPFRLSHGGADGADEDADAIAVSLRIPRTIWIPDSRVHKDWTAKVPIDVHYLLKSPLERNWDIIKDARVLLVTPSTPQEQLRSGTWACYRYAAKQGTPRWIIAPDGTLRKEE